jgi:FtsH ternary system domain X6
MKSVSRFENNLLRLLHFFLRQAPIQQALPLLENKLDRPRCLSRNAIDLVKDALAKGTTLLLTHLGGWRRERHLRDGEIREGRLWERTTPKELGLTFSGMTLDFLMWVTAKKPDENKKGWQPAEDVTLGDLLLLYFAVEQLRSSEMSGNLLKQTPLDSHGLLYLAYPDAYAKASSTSLPDFRPWVSGKGACIVEAMQPAVAERWAQMEIDKGLVSDWKLMRDLGQAQERSLSAFLTAVEKEGRFDLARFLLIAARRVLTASAASDLWVKGLKQHAQRLADRAETYRGALAFVRQMPRLQQWERNARSVGYFDEGYQASQLWKADWERHEGDTLTERARVILHQLDPMRQTEG